MATEIERKWVADGVPHDRLGGDASSLRQGYIALDRGVSVRVRITDDDDAVLTVKAGSGLERTEVEVPVSRPDAEQLWPLTVGRRITKRRFAVSLLSGANGRQLTAEIDVYGDELDGLCTVEVEFTSAEQAADFEAPPWFGEEVTGDDRWSNASLARYGRPDT